MKRIWESIADGLESYGSIIGTMIGVGVLFGIIKLIEMMGVG